MQCFLFCCRCFNKQFIFELEWSSDRGIAVYPLMKDVNGRSYSMWGSMGSCGEGLVRAFSGITARCDGLIHRMRIKKRKQAAFAACHSPMFFTV